MRNALFVLLALTFCPVALAAPDAYYNDEPSLFSMRPDSTKSSYTLDRFGPVGISLDLIQPAFTMKVKGIEKGSPAEKAGLKPGQIIESINGEKLADIDPRIQLGNMITKAEAGDGRMVMLVADQAGGENREITVQLEPLGAYSDTWPLDCPKSDRIVRDLAEYLKKPDAKQGFGSLGMLFLLSTGDESDLDHVRQWARGVSADERSGFHTWNAGYGHLALCEYYLRTGDEAVLPAIQAVVNHALKNENNGSWGNRAPIAGLSYGGGGGHLSASSVHLATFLVLAKLCGAEMPDADFLRILQHHARWAGRGNVPYGNNKPEGSYTDNGKNGGLAFTLAAAARLSPDGEDSAYAQGRDLNALFSFTSTSFMLHGHTGGGIGEVWRSAAMGLLHEKRPVHYRDFMDQRRWHYELSRRHDGSFGILGGERYDDESWGAGYALTYTVPRKTLQLTGAPLSPHAKQFELPEIVWGTAEDNDFLTIDPIAEDENNRPNYLEERLATGGGIALLDVRGRKLADHELAKYIRHPTFVTRTYFIAQIAEEGEDFVLELLAHDDARMRRLGLDTVVYRGGTPALATPKVIDRALEMVADDQESWFVKEAALRLIGLAPPDTIAKHVDVLTPYLEHEEWWLRDSALTALTPVATHPEVYEKVLTAMGRLLETNHLYNVTSAFRWGPLPDALRQADPEVAAYAAKVFKESYVDYEAFEHPVENVADRINPGMKEEIARAITKLPGGYDVLFEIARQQSPGKALPYEAMFLEADASKFSPELQEAMGVIVETKLIPRYIAQNREYLIKERENLVIPWNFYYREPRVEGLVALYQRLGKEDYDWHDFGGEPTEMSWQYHTFDPADNRPWDATGERYREVNLPDGMAEWFKPEFDADAAGWKSGQQPFGATNGELVGVTVDGSRTGEAASPCPYDFCRHGLPMKTLWDKEVLLMRGTFEFPEFKKDHRYRLVVGGMSHVGAGEGFKIYVNGKPFLERERGVGKREGALPIGKHIDKSWWDDFSGKEVDIAHVSFMNIHKGWKNRHLMIWVQEMKLPPLDDAVMIDSAKVVAMTSSHWQLLQDPDNNDLDPNEGKFVWDGKYNNDAAFVGKWKTIAVVPQPDDFDPAKPANASKTKTQSLELKADGKTDNQLLIWTDDLLLDLSGNQALRMQVKTIDGAKYLFVEDGGFETKRGSAWKSPWVVLKAEASK